MPVAVVVAQTAAPTTMVLAALRPVTGLALSDLQHRLEAGIPLVEQELFLNDHDEVRARIEALIDAADDVGLILRFYELQPGDTLSNETLAYAEISEETLRNLLAG